MNDFESSFGECVVRKRWWIIISTVIGFLTMNFSDVPPLRDLGNIAAFGIIAAFLYATLFLPAMMAVLPVRTRQRTESALLMKMGR